MRSLFGSLRHIGTAAARAAWGLFAVMVALLLPGVACTPREPTTPCRVLFIGDSYTYFNDMPKIVQAIAQSTPGREIVAERVTNSAYTLHHHWIEGKAAARIRENRWEIVILQEENGVPANQATQFQEDVRLFVQTIRESGAQPLLLMIWPPRDKPYLQPAAERVMYRVARTYAVPVIPVGAAWRKWLEDPHAPRLHAPDNRHPNFRGSYLTALTIVEMLRGGQPLSDPPTDLRASLINNETPFEPRIDPAELPRLLECAQAVQKALPEPTSPPTPQTRPEKGGLTLTGTVTVLAPDRWTLSVSSVTTPDGKTTWLSPARTKVILLTDGLTIPPDVRIGDTLRVYGQDSGTGTPLTASSIAAVTATR